MAEDEALDAVEENAPEAAERPDWLPDNFTDPQALVQSYRESQRKITEQGNELADLRDTVETLSTQFDQPPQQQQYQAPLEQNPLLIAYQYARETGDVAAELRLQAQLNEAMIQQQFQHYQSQQQQAQPAQTDQDFAVVTTLAENQMRSQNPDFDQHRDAIMQILTDHPNLLPDGSFNSVHNGLTTALDIARGRAYQQQQQKANAEQARAEQVRLEKLQAQTVEGGGAKLPSPDQQKQTWAEIAGADLGAFKLPM